jgi:hypothetical protein
MAFGDGIKADDQPTTDRLIAASRRVINQPTDHLVTASGWGQSRLVVLRDFLNMLYGPVTALLRPAAASVRIHSEGSHHSMVGPCPSARK